MKRIHYESHSPNETERIAGDMGKNARIGDCYALIGDLGCGKTLFTKAFALGMGIQDEITSPTFTLLEEYAGRVPLFHFDLYRINNAEEIDAQFLEEYWEGNGVSVIEWADRATELLPARTIFVRFEYAGDTTRRLYVEYPDDRNLD